MSLCAHISLFSCSLLVLLSLSISSYIPDSNPLLLFNDQVRERHLYTDNQRKELFLEMTPDGKVTGSPAQTFHSVLEMRSVRQGETVIKGVSSSLFLCVDSIGQLRGQSHYTEADCSFRELLLADGYSRFFSSHHKLYVSLASKGSTPQHGLPFSRFLPLRNILVSRSMTNTAENRQQNQQQLDLDSDNPFGRGLTGVVSPQFSRDK
ncbi:fibroblast growth factor 21 [Salvelinus fontinalis]|uniref:fibroblast growth factor 21 n=1 Tax=Salvelinus fontinalis TaxID=8038 RepID=UPI0024861241|nr:fibroblast growth factor 21 [Salvelinus fontinalis]